MVVLDGLFVYVYAVDAVVHDVEPALGGGHLEQGAHGIYTVVKIGFGILPYA